MATFRISAPGRIVLAGEHSVMYKKHLITSSIDIRTKLEFYEILSTDERIEIDFSDINLQTNIPLNNVLCFFSENFFDRSNPTFMLKYVKSLITCNGMWATDEQRFSLIIFFTVLYSIANSKSLDITPFRVRVSTDIPIGAGLGSSTSFTVCLAACFLHWKNLQSENHIDFNNTEFLENVKYFAQLCEDFVQDYDFTLVDVKVCVYGKILKSRLCNNVRIETNFGNNLARMKILLIDSGIRQEKCIQARKMALLKLELPHHVFYNIIEQLNEFAHNIFAWLNTLSLTVQNVFNLSEQRRFDNLQEFYDNIQRRIARIQHLLNENDLTHNVFNNIFATARNMGFAAKVTGFGPKYAYILLPPNFTNDQMERIKTQLRGQNFIVINTSINCDGVKLEN